MRALLRQPFALSLCLALPAAQAAPPTHYLSEVIFAQALGGTEAHPANIIIRASSPEAACTQVIAKTSDAVLRKPANPLVVAVEDGFQHGLPVTYYECYAEVTNPPWYLLPYKQDMGSMYPVCPPDFLVSYPYGICAALPEKSKPAPKSKPKDPRPKSKP